MKIVEKALFVAATWLSGTLFVSCISPYKPNYDIGDGLLIYKNTCDSQPVYLMDIALLKAYASGYSYPDTLTLNGVTYTHVVRLDSSQSAFLSKKKLFDKLHIEFIRDGQHPLPACTGLYNRTLETTKILNIGSTDY